MRLKKDAWETRLNRARLLLAKRRPLVEALTELGVSVRETCSDEVVVSLAEVTAREDPAVRVGQWVPYHINPRVEVAWLTRAYQLSVRGK